MQAESIVLQYSDQVISCGGDPAEIATCGRWPRGRSQHLAARWSADLGGVPDLGAAVTVEHAMQRVRGSEEGAVSGWRARRAQERWGCGV